MENAKECFEAAEGKILLGVLSKNYSTDEAAIEDMKKYQAEIENALSVGLGAGDPNQSEMVSRISAVLQPQHVNQVFTGAATSRALLGQEETIVNALVSPTGKVGFVNIATGPLSSQEEPTEVPLETAIALLKDMGASSIKYFPMKGLAHKKNIKRWQKLVQLMTFILNRPVGLILITLQKSCRLLWMQESRKSFLTCIARSLIQRRAIPVRKM